MNKLNKEDIKFLKELQHEMLIQDTCCQASPRFWVVQQKVRTYGVDVDYGIDGSELINKNDFEDSIDLKNKEDIIELCKYLELKCEIKNEKLYIEDKWMYDNEDIIECLKNNGYDNYYIVNYKEEYQIVENTFFLTLKECKEHIEANHYHYNKPRPYAMTAWRSPQVEKLYEIIQNTNWD